MIMISYQLAEPFHFYPINILAALKWLLPKSCNKIYMDWTDFFFLTVILKSHFIYFLILSSLKDLNSLSKMLKSNILACELVQGWRSNQKEQLRIYVLPPPKNIIKVKSECCVLFMLSISLIHKYLLSVAKYRHLF